MVWLVRKDNNYRWREKTHFYFDSEDAAMDKAQGLVKGCDVTVGRVFKRGDRFSQDDTTVQYKQER